MSDLIPEVSPELGIEVPISQIDRELKKLWEQDEARTNASLMNLVVYAERDGGLLENSRIINQLTRENACRAILVEINRGETASLRAWITAHCHLSQGAKSVCCEQISFRLTGRVTGRFRNTVFSHLNSDLPLIFWWQGELSEVFTERLVSVMDRLIVDSSEWEDPTASFARIQENIRENSRLIVQDLAWTRCWQYRVGVAALFDDPKAQEALPTISKVSIRFHPKHRNTALLLAAWVAVQAKWDFVNGGKLRSADGQEIELCLNPDQSSPALGELMLSSENTNIHLKRDDGGSYIFRAITNGDYQVNSLAPGDPEESSELVAQQLSRGGKNSLFLKVLPMFLEFLKES